MLTALICVGSGLGLAVEVGEQVTPQPSMCRCGTVEIACPPQFLEALDKAKKWDVEPVQLRPVVKSDWSLRWTIDGRLPVVTLVGSSNELASVWRNANQRGFVSIRTRGEYWVTLKDDFVKRVIALSEANATEQLPRRVRQLLGLRPCDLALDTVVELSVTVDPNAESIVRPCYDSEITDDRCIKAKRDTPLASRVDEWAKWEYPFTRLGYTYDWGGDGKGLSEYVIMRDVEVRVHRVLAIDGLVTYARSQHQY